MECELPCKLWNQIGTGTCIFLPDIMTDSPLNVWTEGLRRSSLFTNVASTASEQPSVAQPLTKVLLLDDESYWTFPLRAPLSASASGWGSSRCSTAETKQRWTECYQLHKAYAWCQECLFFKKDICSIIQCLDLWHIKPLSSQIQLC